MTEPQHPAVSFDAYDAAPSGDEPAAPRVPEQNYWFQRHLFAYRFAAGTVAGMRTLDVACGEGFGTAVLAETAADATGLDVDETAIARAADRYPRARFRAGSLTRLPFEDGFFDAVVSLQTIEHVAAPHELVAECARVLSPGGVLVLATPNRLTFSHRGLRNPFHTFEFAPAELEATLRQQFREVTLLGTFHRARIKAVEIAIRRSFPERLIQQPAPEWPWWLRARVAAVTAEDFALRMTRVERALDLVAVARV